METTKHPSADVIAKVRREVAENGLSEPDGVRSLVWIVLTPIVWVGLFVAARSIDHWIMWVAAWTVQSLFILTAIAGQHEAIHRNLFKAQWANHLCGQLWALIILFPYGTFRAAHLQHHVTTHAKGDSEPVASYKGLLDYLVLTPISGLLALFFNWSWAISTLIGRPPAFMRTAAQRRVSKISTLIALVPVLTVAWASIYAPATLLAFWGVPALVGALLAVMVSLPEHYLCDHGPASALETTRSTSSSAIIRFFFWGTNYHTAHHVMGGIPSQRLAEVNEMIEPHCDYVETSYLRWHGRLFVMMLRGNHPAVTEAELVAKAA